MTCNNRDNIMSEILELVVEDGFDGVGEAVKLLVNLEMEVERDNYVGVAHYERSSHRRSYRNGHKSKRVKTRLGELE